MENNIKLSKVLSVGSMDDRYSEKTFTESMNELRQLARNLEGDVVAEVIQKRKSPHPATYLGKGKLEEIKQLEEELEIDVILFNDELSPSQVRTLAKIFDAKILDRTQLILDIFQRRASSREGKLQIELAQFQYILPRLMGQGVNLSRLGGGIGTRGPGETKLESDRRYIRKRITEIKGRLNQIVSHRERYRSRRKKNQAIQISIVGYTNAGKSTLFNRLTLSNTFEEDLLFATLDPMTRQFNLPCGLKTLLTDTVGFIRDLPTTLIAAFRSTLEEVREADLILHVVDASDDMHDSHEATVLQLLEELEVLHIPMLTVYNKRDSVVGEFYPHAEGESILISAFIPDDLDKLKDKIESMLIKEMKAYHVKIPYEQSNIIPMLKQFSVVKKYEEQDDGYECKGYILPENAMYNEIKQLQNREE